MGSGAVWEVAKRDPARTLPTDANTFSVMLESRRLEWSCVDHFPRGGRDEGGGRHLCQSSSFPSPSGFNAGSITHFTFCSSSCFPFVLYA